MSPRYDLVAPLDTNKDIVEESGIYSWFEDGDADGKKIMEEYNNLVKECSEISDEHNFMWHPPINKDIYFYKEKS